MGSGAAGADFFVPGVQDLHRIGQLTGAFESLEREAIEHQAAFHVGDAGTIGEVGVAAVAASRGGAFGEHRVAMAQQQHRLSRGTWHFGEHHVAKTIDWHALEQDAVGFQFRREQRAYRVDARLVIAVGVGVDDTLQQRFHGVALVGKPVQRLLWRGTHCACSRN
nr:hypothetical protein GCM10020185_86410 [Pseudomonas brassicacearum subsp. brassicacearum]